MIRIKTWAAIPVLAAASLGGAAAAQTISNLGLLPGTTESVATGMSADGSVVVGSCVIDHIEGYSKAFRWSEEEGLQDLGGLPGGAVNSTSAGVSADGSVAVGTASAWTVPARSWRWTAAGMQSLSLVRHWDFSDSIGVSGNGQVVVGYGQPASGWNLAFRWTSAGGMQALGTLPGGVFSRAYAANTDGSVLTGVSNSSAGFRAFRWTLAGGMQNLGVLPGGDWSEGHAISADGSVIVGYSSGAAGNSTWFSQHSIRWTSAGGMQHLGTLPGGMYSSAEGLTPDGSIVVGFSSGDGINTYHAIMWTAALGLVDLNTYFAARGVNLQGWELEYARGVTADGSIFCGSGLFNGGKRAWVVRLAPPCGSADFNHDGDIGTDQDIQAFFACVAGACCPACGSADFNSDGDLATDTDIEAFFSVLSGAPC